MLGSTSSKKLKRKEDTKKFSISHMKQKIGLGTVKTMAPEAYGALKISLKVSVEALDKVPVPGLKAAGTGLLALLKAIDDTNANQEQIRRLGAQIDRLLEYIIKPLLSQAENGDKIPEDLKGRVERLSRNLESIFEEGQKIVSRNAFSRFLLHEDIREQIYFLINRMSEALDSFLVAGIIQIDRVVNNIESEARSIGLGMENVVKKLKNIDRTLNRNIRDGTPKTLPHAPARYKDQRENKQISTCLPNTRVELLCMINEWVHDRENPPIFWLSGMAGTGKSTIAKTLSQSLDKPKPEDYLGASFFCSRDDDELSRDHLIIPNIAYQLAQYDERIYSGVAKSLLADPDLADLDIENQFQKLILEPLQNSSTRRTLIVIVIDALDECSGKPEEIVALFASPQLTSLPFLVKLFVTGRPEARIRQALSRSHVKSQLQPLQLHEIEHSIVRSDIGLYLNHHFKLVTEVRSHLSRNWPSEADVQALGDLAGDLFIFAATAMKFINNPEEDPKDKLNLILTNVHSSGHIDLLYNQVLGSTFPPNQGDNIKSFQDVMGAVLCLREPLTIQALQMLLGISSSSVRKVLTRLYSVVITPDTDDDYIRLIHPSFPDYLADEQRCTERKYLINKPIQHANLAHCALNCMIKELKRNICKLEDPLAMNEEIGDLSYRLSSYISSQLHYSCFYWASHLHSVDQSKDLLELLHSFATTKLLAWLEVLVLYGRIDIALDSIRSVRLWLFGCSHESSNTLELMENMERFVKQFSKGIGISPGNIYASALPFTPDCLLSEVYNHERVNSGRIINHNMLKWKSCLSIMRGHMRSILWVTFSPDGSKIISGSHDQTIRIWDSTSGASVSTLKGHSGSVFSVAFSPDGSKIISGSDDQTIQIWNSASGASVATLQGHSGPVWSIAFSPDGSEVVSGSGDKTIRIWDSTSGSLVATLRGHLGPVWSVAFSPDGSKIASGSSDQTIRIWDPTNGLLVATLRGHSGWVWSVAFSPDGSKIVSGSDDQTIQIWNSTSGTSLVTLKGHSDIVSSLAFSPDGSKIVSGSRDQTIRIWNSVSGASVATLKGHSSWVYSVTFSPDGSKIVSGSDDQTIRMWNSASGASLVTLKGHSDTVSSLEFSLHGPRIVSGSYDQTIRVWDLRTIEALAIYQCSSPITLVHFSYDGNTISFRSKESYRNEPWQWKESELESPVENSHEDVDWQSMDMVMKDGWIVSSKTKKRYCHIPDTFMNLVEISPYGPYVALIDDEYALYVLNLSHCVHI